MRRNPIPRGTLLHPEWRHIRRYHQFGDLHVVHVCRVDESDERGYAVVRQRGGEWDWLIGPVPWSTARHAAQQARYMIDHGIATNAAPERKPVWNDEVEEFCLRHVAAYNARQRDATLSPA
jgi:hypothetical protein